MPYLRRSGAESQGWLLLALIAAPVALFALFDGAAPSFLTGRPYGSLTLRSGAHLVQGQAVKPVEAATTMPTTLHAMPLGLLAAMALYAAASSRAKARSITVVQNSAFAGSTAPAVRATETRMKVIAGAFRKGKTRRNRDQRTNWKDNQLGYRIHGPPGYPGSPHAWTERIRWCNRFKRRIHIRRTVEGTSARPRLAVFRSLKHIHVNVVDDTTQNGITLLCSSTVQKHNAEEVRTVQGGKNWTWTNAAAEVIGRDVAKKCAEKNITTIVFDRGGFRYEGRIAALAEAARSAGLQF